MPDGETAPSLPAKGLRLRPPPAAPGWPPFSTSKLSRQPYTSRTPESTKVTAKDVHETDESKETKMISKSAGLQQHAQYCTYTVHGQGGFSLICSRGMTSRELLLYASRTFNYTAPLEENMNKLIIKVGIDSNF